MPIGDLKEPQRGPIGHALFLLPRTHGLGAHVQGLGEHRLGERETCAKARDTSARTVREWRAEAAGMMNWW